MIGEDREMRTQRITGKLLGAMLAVAAVVLTGCVVSSSDIHQKGVTEERARRVKCGETTREDLVQMFGEPFERQMRDNGTEIMRYKGTVEKEGALVICPIVVIKEDKTTEQVISFEVRDGVVRRYHKGG